MTLIKNDDCTLPTYIHIHLMHGLSARQPFTKEFEKCKQCLKSVKIYANIITYRNMLKESTKTAYGNNVDGA